MISDMMVKNSGVNLYVLILQFVGVMTLSVALK